MPHELSCGCSISHFYLSSLISMPSESVDERKLMKVVSMSCSLCKGRGLTKFKRASKQRKGTEPKAILALKGDVPQELRCGCSDSHIPFSSCKSMPCCLSEQRAKLTNKRIPGKYSKKSAKNTRKKELTSSKRAARYRERQSWSNTTLAVGC